MPKGVRTPSARHAFPLSEPTWNFDVPPPDNIADPYGDGRRAGMASPLVEAARYWNNRAAAISREQMGPNYPNYYDCEGPSFMGYGSEAQSSAALHDDLNSIWGSQREGPVGPAGVVKDDPNRRGVSVPTTHMGGPPPNPHPYFYGGLRRPEGQRHLPAPDVYFYQPPVHQYMPPSYPYYHNPFQYPQGVPVRTEPYIEVVPPPKPDPPAGTLPPEVGDRWWKCTSERHNTTQLTTEIKATVLAKQLAEEGAPPPPAPPASGIKAAVLTKHLMNVEQSKVHPYSGVDESQVKAEMGAAAAAKAEADAAVEATRQDIVAETLSVIPLSLRPHIISLMPSLNGTVIAPPPPPEIPEAIPGKTAYFDREITRVMGESAVVAAVEAAKVPPPPPVCCCLPPPPTIDQSITLAVNAEMSRILGRPFEAPPAPPPPTTLEDAIAVEVTGAMSRILGRPCGPAKGEPADSTFAATIDELVKNELSRVLPFGLPAVPEAPTWESAVAAAVQGEVSKIYGVPPSGSPPPSLPPAPTTWEGAVASAVQQEISKLYGVPPPPPPPTAWESAVAAAVEKEMSRVQGYPPQPFGGAYQGTYPVHPSQLYPIPRDQYSPSHYHSAMPISHHRHLYDHQQYDRLSPLRNQEPIPRALPRHVVPRRPLRSAEASADELALQELLTESQCVVGGRDLLRRLPRRAPSMLHTSPPRPIRNDDAEPQPEEESYIFNGDELRAALEEAGDEEAVHCVVRRDQSRACGAAGSWVRMQRREGPTRHALGCAAPPPIELVGGADDAPIPTNASVAAMSAFMGLRDQAAARRQMPPLGPAYRAQAPVYGDEPPVVAVPPAAFPAKRTLPVSTATMLARKRAAAAAAAKDTPQPSQTPPSQPSLQDFFKQRRSKLEEERRQAELNEPLGPDSVPPPSRRPMGEDAPVLPL